LQVKQSHKHPHAAILAINLNFATEGSTLRSPDLDACAQKVA
jgi:hypothetical protein